MNIYVWDYPADYETDLMMVVANTLEEAMGKRRAILAEFWDIFPEKAAEHGVRVPTEIIDVETLTGAVGWYAHHSG